MTAKEFLKQYAQAERLAVRYRTEYEKELMQIDTIRSAGSGDGMPGAGKISAPTEAKALRLAEKLTTYQNAVLDAIELKREVLKMIEYVPGEYGAVLYERYIQLKTWEEVADSIGYSLRQTHRFHQQALLMMQDIIEWHTLS